MSDFDPDHEPLVRVTMLLADSAQVADSKLYVLGGGITEIPADPVPLAVAVLIDVPWDRANISHDWQLELLDEDGAPVFANDRPVIVGGTFEAGRPAGAVAGAPMRVPMAINFGALPVAPGRRYVWRLAVNGTSEPEWTLEFGVRLPPGTQPAAPPPPAADPGT